MDESEKPKQINMDQLPPHIQRIMMFAAMVAVEAIENGMDRSEFLYYCENMYKTTEHNGCEKVIKWIDGVSTGKSAIEVNKSD